MLGWINDCVEKLVVEKYGVDAWHKVKERAGCDYKDGGFLKLEHYPDKSTLDLVNAAAELSNKTQAEVFEAFGQFFVPYIIGEGYENLLCCQGNTLKDWMTNINAIHQHLQTTFPKKMIMPEFWCEESVDDHTLTLFYYSSRGGYLAPLAVGLVTEVAKFQFELDIKMDLKTTQGVDGSRFTSWTVSTVDPKDLYKLSTKKGGRNGIENASTAFKCPFSGMEIDTKSVPGVVVADNSMTKQDYSSQRRSPSPTSVLNNNSNNGTTTTTHTPSDTNMIGTTESGRSSFCPVQHHNKNVLQAQRTNRPVTSQILRSPKRSPTKGSANEKNNSITVTNNNNNNNSNNSNNFTDDTASSSMNSHQQASAWTDDLDDLRPISIQPGGLSATTTQKLFPYHVILDSDFYITQVGPEMPKVLGCSESVLYSYEIDEVFEFIKPKPAKWTKSWLRKLEDHQEFVLESTLESSQEGILFKGTLVANQNDAGQEEIMLILSPDAKNLDELRSMGLTLSDLPCHGAYRDAVFLREHLSQQMNNALKMEKLSKTLQTEKELLESLLPHHAAEELRKGKAVEPMLHNNVTMFFSDIVGFTNICKTISPWTVIHMLNQLYGIMDHLAKKFNLFKVETIGDAYVCCSGLPESDSNHAANVAHFAVAVSQQSGKVKSPLDGSPIQLRIGVHTGACASGIVGVTNPRYCVFGDTVNTTARHESTGEPKRVHCSLTTMIELMQRAPTDFNLISRGLVDMKGKGAQPTYWLEASEENKQTGKKGMKRIDKEIDNKFSHILGDNHEQDDMDMSARHVVAMPGMNNKSIRNKTKSPKRRPKLTSAISKRRVVSSDELEAQFDSDDDEDDDDDDETVSTDSSRSSTREGGASGNTLWGEFSSAGLSTCSSASPSKSQLDLLIEMNARHRPKENEEDAHNFDLLHAIQNVEAVMSSRK